MQIAVIMMSSTPPPLLNPSPNLKVLHDLVAYLHRLNRHTSASRDPTIAALKALCPDKPVTRKRRQVVPTDVKTFDGTQVETQDDEIDAEDASDPGCEDISEEPLIPPSCCPPLPDERRRRITVMANDNACVDEERACPARSHCTRRRLSAS